MAKGGHHVTSINPRERTRTVSPGNLSSNREKESLEGSERNRRGGTPGNYPFCFLSLLGYTIGGCHE